VIRIGVIAAALGIALALGSLMMQFLGAGEALLAQLLWLHVAVVALVLASVICCFINTPQPVTARLGRLWEALPGLVVRFAGLLIFVIATAELALWLVHDLTGRPTSWTLHFPSALAAIYVLGACCCIAARSRQASGA
jgi:hypothetical protein